MATKSKTQDEVEKLEITNFTGRLTRYNDGDINSGYAKYNNTFGNDPFTTPGNLTWFESPTRIDPNATVITDLIVAGKTRVESSITYDYLIGSTGRVYKVQVNDPTTYNPNYDNAILLTTLTAQSPTFRYGASLQFFGTTERMIIGHDVGVTRLNFDGTGETFIGAAGSYTANVPRPSGLFLGKYYAGNGINILELDSSLNINYTKLSPGFPPGTQVRDIDLSPDGNILQITASRVPAPDMTSTTQDTASIASGDSYIFKWNGIDTGYTASDTFNAYSTNANLSFASSSYTMGYDLGSVAIYSTGQKVVTLPNSLSPNFNSLFSTGNMLGFAAPEQDASVLKGSLLLYGQYDKEVPEGLFRPFRISATTQTDIIQIPVCQIVSNLFYGASYAGYTNNIVGSAKIYFSTFEGVSGPTATGKLYKFTTVPTGVGTSIAGVYETQTQLFSKKIKISEVRVYGEPWVTNNSFRIDLIGSSGNSITNSNKTFAISDGTLVVGDDFAYYAPEISPTYALGLRITNAGSANHVITKVEIDYSYGGK